MKKIGDITNTADKNGEFTDGNVAAGTPPTQLMGSWFNSVQREILNVLVKAGIPQSATKEDQLAEAIGKLIESAGYVTPAAMTLELNKKFDKANISSVKGNENDKVPSLNLFTTETGKLQPKGDYQPAGSYATTQALNDGLGKKFDKTSVAQSTGASTENVISQAAATNNFAKKSLIDVFDGTSTKIKSNDGVSSLILGGAGYLVVRNEQTGVNNFSIDSSGKMNDGIVPVQRLIGISQSSGSSTTDIMSQKAVTNIAFGVGQKWIDVISLRSKGVIYTNTSDKAIMVSVGGNRTSPIITVDNVIVKKNADNQDSLFIPIPSGSTYLVNSTGDILYWTELR